MLNGTVGSNPPSPPNAQIAQSVEQGTENPRVGGSIPPLGTKKQARPVGRGPCTALGVPSTEWSQSRRLENIKPLRLWEEILRFMSAVHEMVLRSRRARTKTR